MLLVPGLLLDGSSAPRLHRIALMGDSTAGKYRFSPTEVTASPGDTLLFVVESGGPHALGFDPTGLPAPLRDAWTRALVGRVADFRGPLLRGTRRYPVVVPAGMRPGRYSFFCLAHRAYDMRMVVEVK